MAASLSGATVTELPEEEESSLPKLDKDKELKTPFKLKLHDH